MTPGSVGVTPKVSELCIIGVLLQISTVILIQSHGALLAYYVDTVGKNEKMTKDYIRNQLEEDYTSDQISLKEFTDLFTGNKRK